LVFPSYLSLFPFLVTSFKCHSLSPFFFSACLTPSFATLSSFGVGFCFPPPPSPVLGWPLYTFGWPKPLSSFFAASLTPSYFRSPIHYDWEICLPFLLFGNPSSGIPPPPTASFNPISFIFKLLPIYLPSSFFPGGPGLISPLSWFFLSFFFILWPFCTFSFSVVYFFFFPNFWVPYPFWAPCVQGCSLFLEKPFSLFPTQLLLPFNILFFPHTPSQNGLAWTMAPFIGFRAPPLPFHLDFHYLATCFSFYPFSLIRPVLFLFFSCTFTFVPFLFFFYSLRVIPSLGTPFFPFPSRFFTSSWGTTFLDLFSNSWTFLPWLS